MRILIIGASEGTGALAVHEVLARGHEVTAFSRNPAKLVLRIPITVHERQEQMTKTSGLEWSIVRPGRLTKGVATKSYKKIANLEKVPASISRPDFANCLAEAATTPQWVRKAVQVGS